MKPILTSLRVGALAFLLFASAAHAQAQTSDYAREKRWADEIVPALMVGDAVWLQGARSHKFLALYTEARPVKPSPGAKAPRPGVVLVHGMGVHPEFGAVGGLRARLADAGYTTLSVQMPILASDAPAEGYPALFGEGAERLAAAAAFLQNKGHPRIALVSHSMGSRMVNHYLAANPKAPLAGWVSLAISSGEFDPKGLGGFPVYDIYAEKDFPVVLQHASQRARLLARIPGSQQAMVNGSDHYFSGKDRELATLVGLMLDPASANWRR
jgi:dienelactone hydrolase